MTFIDRDGVIVSYANPADEALAFAVADRPHADGLHTRAEQTRIAIDFSTEIDFPQCSGWGCVGGCIDCMRGCEFCRVTHSLQNCPVLYALLTKEAN